MKIWQTSNWLRNVATIFLVWNSLSKSIFIRHFIKVIHTSPTHTPIPPPPPPQPPPTPHYPTPPHPTPPPPPPPASKWLISKELRLQLWIKSKSIACDPRSIGNTKRAALCRYNDKWRWGIAVTCTWHSLLARWSTIGHSMVMTSQKRTDTWLSFHRSDVVFFIPV